VLVLVYRVAEGQLGRIVPLFLLDPRTRGGLGLTTVELGTIYGTLSTAAYMMGSLAGSAVASRFGLRRALVSVCVVFHLPAAIYLFLSSHGSESRAWITIAVVLEQLSYGVRLARIAAVAANAMASLETFEDRLVRIPSCDANPHASLRQ